MNAIRELEAEYRARGGRAAAPAVHWMLQELRVAQFAQGLGTRGAASAKQVRRALAAVGGQARACRRMNLGPRGSFDTPPGWGGSLRKPWA